jgi:hypothetical protein
VKVAAPWKTRGQGLDGSVEEEEEPGHRDQPEEAATAQEPKTGLERRRVDRVSCVSRDLRIRHAWRPRYAKLVASSAISHAGEIRASSSPATAGPTITAAEA